MFERNANPESPSENGEEIDFDAVIASIMTVIPTGKSVLTVSHEQVRTGLLVRWVQQCSENPPLLSVALPTGESVIPIIRNSRRFTLCQVADDDTFLTRKFARPHEPGEDPFMGLSITIGNAHVPIINRARSFLECLLVGHLDLGVDHRLYVGKVIGGGMLNEDATPSTNGMAPNSESP